MYDDKPLIFEADIIVEEETAYLRELASSFINLPEEQDRQIDLMYFTAIYVSSGENLNNAFFEQQELVLAENTIINKALDIEHKEKDIVGHLYDRVFIDEKGNKLDLDGLKEMEEVQLKDTNMHVAIAGIIYKNRFPEIAKEVADGKWKVSMETYFKDFDIKIGDLVLTRKEAESVGYKDVSSVIGKEGKVFKSGKEIASGTISRVLRGLNFSGCGLVENPANPPSVILEVAGYTPNSEEGSSGKDNKDVVEIDISNMDNNVTSKKIDTNVIDSENSKFQNYSDPDSIYNPSGVGVCVYYKKRVLSKEGKITNENWCHKFDTGCTAFSRTAVDEDCLLRQVDKEVSNYVKKSISKKNIDKELSALEDVLKIREKKGGSANG